MDCYVLAGNKVEVAGQRSVFRIAGPDGQGETLAGRQGDRSCPLRVPRRAGITRARRLTARIASRQEKVRSGSQARSGPWWSPRSAIGGQFQNGGNWARPPRYTRSCQVQTKGGPFET